MDGKVSHELYEKARNYLPGGVCSSVRLNKATGSPFFASRGKGARVKDADGYEFIDVCMSHGASLLGHGHPDIERAVKAALEMGGLCSFETEYHYELAKKICEVIPCAERVRFTNSGTEATMHLLRACRAYTGKDKIIRFEGHFHGYHDYFYIGGHVPLEHLSRENSSTYRECDGIPEEMTDFVISIPFNDPEILEETLRKYKDEAACVILEPINYNSGCIIPDKSYVKLMRELSSKNAILLFFDEIQSSFKIGQTGAQGYFEVIPDVCTIGKALGGGMPLSALCGRKEIMDLFRPVGNVEHSGTFNAHLCSIMAGNAFMDTISEDSFYEQLDKLCSKLYSGIESLFAKVKIKGQIQHCGARFGLFFGIDEQVKNYRQSLGHDTEMMLRFVLEMMKRGIYFCDYGGKACHHGISVAHTEHDIDRILNVMEDVFKII